MPSLTDFKNFVFNYYSLPKKSVTQPDGIPEDYVGFSPALQMAVSAIGAINETSLNSAPVQIEGLTPYTTAELIYYNCALHYMLAFSSGLAPEDQCKFLTKLNVFYGLDVDGQLFKGAYNESSVSTVPTGVRYNTDDFFNKTPYGRAYLQLNSPRLVSLMMIVA